MATAIITGGSSGIGLEFARSLAGQGYNLILIARERVRLNRIAAALAEEFNVRVQPLTADLSDRAKVDKIAELIAGTKSLEIMVNNAGFGVHIDADDNSASAHDLQRSAVDVMALNTLIFSSAAASAMKRRGRGQIINIASTAAWTFQGNYSAIKSYVLVYTQSLALSLEGTGVTATAVCPAWMHTNFHAAAGLDEPSIPEWLYVNPDEVVAAALKGAAAGKSVVIPTWRWRVIIWVLSHGPAALRRLITRLYMSSGNYRAQTKSKGGRRDTS